MWRKLKPLQQSAKDLIFSCPSVEGNTIDLTATGILFCKQIFEKKWSMETIVIVRYISTLIEGLMIRVLPWKRVKRKIAISPP